MSHSWQKKHIVFWSACKKCMNDKLEGVGFFLLQVPPYLWLSGRVFAKFSEGSETWHCIWGSFVEGKVAYVVSQLISLGLYPAQIRFCGHRVTAGCGPLQPWSFILTQLPRNELLCGRKNWLMLCELQPGKRSSNGCSSLRAQLRDFILTYSPTTLILRRSP